MSNTRSRQQGSLHAVIIAVLFVGLMAALGVVFYQNFIAKKEVVVQKEAPKEDKPLVERVAFNSEIYSLEYPKTWKAGPAQTIDPNDTSAKVTVVSNPKDTVEVVLIVASKTTLDPCDVNDGLKISSYSVDQTPVTKLTSSPLYLVESIIDAPGGGYSYMIGLSPDSGATHAAIGESRCNVQAIGLASAYVAQGNKVVTPHISANIIFPKIYSNEEIAIKDMKKIKDMINTDDYKSAVKILKSARKE